MWDYVEEPCPNCGEIVAVDVSKIQNHLETTCPYCGAQMMVCTMCHDWNEACDWTKKNGCHMNERRINNAAQK